MKLTIHTANERLVVALPEQIVARLGWSSGDVLEAEIVGDALKLVRMESDVDRTTRAADEVMDQYSWTLEELAKS
jgi:bifunctional DNA-binding transcriptional regulator/antitoxin component of YhaV-PrlF toxin-antitoxin module